MDFDRLIEQYFGTPDIHLLNSEQLLTGTERLQVHFGLERDRGRRFGLWSLMYMLGIAPDLDTAFKEEDDRNAARDFMDMVDREIDSE